MHFKKRFALLFMVLTLVFVVAACGGNEDNTEETTEGENPELPVQTEEITFTELDRTGLEADKVVVTYEGGEIKGDELARFLAFQGFINPNAPINDEGFRQDIAKFLTLQKIIAPQVENEDWAAEQTESLWENFTVQYDDQTRERAFETLQITEDEVKENLHIYFLTEDYFRQQVAEEEVLAEYEKFEEQLTTADVRHILISTHEPQADGTMKEVRPDEEAKQIADDLYQQLQDGADFAELAKEHTGDTASKENGGLMEDAPIAQFVPEFKSATLTQPIGEIGEPVKTQYGYHIILVESRQTEPYENVKDYLHSQLAGMRVNDYYENTLPDQIIEVKL